MAINVPMLALVCASLIVDQEQIVHRPCGRQTDPHHLLTRCLPGPGWSTVITPRHSPHRAGKCFLRWTRWAHQTHLCPTLAEGEPQQIFCHDCERVCTSSFLGTHPTLTASPASSFSMNGFAPLATLSLRLGKTSSGHASYLGVWPARSQPLSSTALVPSLSLPPKGQDGSLTLLCAKLGSPHMPSPSSLVSCVPGRCRRGRDEGECPSLGSWLAFIH